jgi:hypothetical protein
MRNNWLQHRIKLIADFNQFTKVQTDFLVRVLFTNFTA